jgi:hypothetical protein
MDFSWLKNFSQKAQETAKGAANFAKEAGKGVGEFIKEHPEIIEDAIKIVGTGLVNYYTAQGLLYSKKLNEAKNNYEKSMHEQYKKQAKNILNEISNIFKSQSLTPTEQDELDSILNQHSSWVCA